MGNSFSPLIKNFDKIRDYMRDFYIYGFKTRNDFQYKSLRTYDDERRRIENWLGNFTQCSNSRKGKQVFISCDSSTIEENPLYNAYRYKSFTKNDIQLHFFILDILREDNFMSLNEITDRILDEFEVIFDAQTVRLKLNEYVREGIIISKKQGRSMVSAKSPDSFRKLAGDDSDKLTDMIKFFSEASPFGIVGNYILKSLSTINNLFLIKHNFLVHTLEDNILLSLCQAMDEKRFVKLINYGKSHKETHITGIPLRFHVSTQTGRRYIIIYLLNRKRFSALRLDYIKSVGLLESCPEYDYYIEKYLKNSGYCWGTSFGAKRPGNGMEYIRMTLSIDEQNEGFILHRLKREGRNGIIQKKGENIFCYYGEFFDVSELSPWIKTFTGRIIKLESNNRQVLQRFYGDIRSMKKMYEVK